MKQELESPGFRYSLIWELEDFSDPEKQNEKFCAKERDDAFSGSVKESIEGIFDYYFESPNPVELGDIFRTKDEINQMHRFGETLREMQAWIYKDGHQKDSYYMDSPLWKEVTRLAKKTYDFLRKDEDMDELLASEQRRSARVAEEEAKKVITPEEEQER